MTDPTAIAKLYADRLVAIKADLAALKSSITYKVSETEIAPAILHSVDATQAYTPPSATPVPAGVTAYKNLLAKEIQ